MIDDVFVLGEDSTGLIAESEGMRYYLTDCCAGSAKGMENYVGCRACYMPISDELGGLPEQSGPVPTPYGDGLTHTQFLAKRDPATGRLPTH